MKDPFVPLFLAIEEQMRAAGQGAMVDRALQNARRSLIAVLRAELEWRRHRDYEKWLLMERLSPIVRRCRTPGFFR